MASRAAGGEAPDMAHRYTPEQRARLVARYRRGGLTQREFAEREGITLSARKRPTKHG